MENNNKCSTLFYCIEKMNEMYSSQEFKEQIMKDIENENVKSIIIGRDEETYSNLLDTNIDWKKVKL